MANKDIKNEPTGIENLNESLTSFSAKVEKHKNVILYVVGSIVVAALAGIGLYFWDRDKNQKSARAFPTALVSATKEIQKAAQTSDNQDSLYAAVMIKRMQELAKKEDGRTGGTLAQIELAGLYYNNGKPKEALAALEATDIDEPVMEMSALVLKGDCYVDLKKNKEAISAYDEAFDKAKEENPEIAARVLMKKARVLDSEKKYADALALYEQILKDYPLYANMNVEAYAERERALAGK